MCELTRQQMLCATNAVWRAASDALDAWIAALERDAPKAEIEELKAKYYAAQERTSCVEEFVVTCR